MPRFFGPELQRVDVRGCWRPEIMEALRVFNRVGLLGTDPVRLPQGGECGPKAFLREFFLQQSHPTDDGEWAFLVNVEVVGRRGASQVVVTYNLSHPPKSEWQFACTAKVTGIPASIGAQLLAAGRATRAGVLAPEACFDPQEFFGELARRDILVHERVVVRQTLGEAAQMPAEVA
jgi:saccharopine dehydrogenase-like NADP-dependent oxidoreductase